MNIPDNCDRVKHAIVSGVRIATELRVPFSRESPIQGAIYAFKVLTPTNSTSVEPFHFLFKLSYIIICLVSPRHKHWSAGPAHFSDGRASSGQYILSFTGPYGPPRYMSGHQISNSAGLNDDKSHYVLFARAPAPHLGSFRVVLLLQRDASVAQVGHVNQTH